MNSSAFPSLVGPLLDPEDGNSKILSEESVSPRCGGESPDADCGRPSKKRRVTCDTAPSNDEEGEDCHSEGAPASSQLTSATKEEDAFLYYSNNKRRLERLLGKELPHVQSPEEPVKRKTRISFELDPLFDMVSNYPELLDESFGDASEGSGEAVCMSIKALESLLRL